MSATVQINNFLYNFDGELVGYRNPLTGEQLPSYFENEDNTQENKIFTPEQFGAKGDVVGAHDGVWDGTWFSSGSYFFTPADVGKNFWLDANTRTITEVNTEGKCKTSPAPYGTTGILWVSGSDDTAAIQAAIDAARAVQGPDVTEDNTPTDQLIRTGGIVKLQAGKIYGIRNTNSGKDRALTIYRRMSLIGSGESSHRSALVLLPGSYGSMVANLGATYYTDFFTMANITLYGYKEFNANATDGINFQIPVGAHDKTDAFNRFENITVVKAKQDGFRFSGRGELVVEKCDSFNAGRYNMYMYGQYDYKVISCNFGGASKTGVRVYASGAGNWTTCKSFYNGAGGTTTEKDCANLVLEGDQMRAGFTWFSNCQFQESRGSSAVIQTGMNIFSACQFLDPDRTGMNGSTKPTIRAGIHLSGEGCRMNVFSDCIVSPSVAVYSATNWNSGTYGVYIDDYTLGAGGPQENRGTIWTYVDTLNAGGATQTGAMYAGGASKVGGAGASNGKNTNLKVDGAACT